ncbi:hypothetical protein B0H14DRAFT_3483970 [Mycena olivaceomarginata]|nr:hypothetical protein B0H14DRAFT_3483970 [Mycena olivaceomarginata]
MAITLRSRDVPHLWRSASSLEAPEHSRDEALLWSALREEPHLWSALREGPHLWSALREGPHLWEKRFSKEFDEGGVIDILTPAEKLLIFIPATNDANEGILGGWRVHARTRSASTIYHFSAQTTYHRNNTENFAAAKLNTEEDALFIMRFARVEDASGAMRKFRDELLARDPHRTVYGYDRKN